jgi:hypothetical protein
MKYKTIRDFRIYQKNISDEQREIKDMDVTNNGKPISLLIPLLGTNFENTLKAVRQANLKIDADNMRETALRKNNYKLYRKDSNRFTIDTGKVK